MLSMKEGRLVGRFGGGESKDGRRLALRRSSHFGVVDLGASKVSCLILQSSGVSRDDKMLRASAASYVQSAGVRDGAIVNVSEATRAIAEAVEQAEAKAGVDLDGVTIVTACGQLASHRVEARIGVGGRQITDSDVKRVVNQAMAGLRLNRRRPIHLLPIAWSVDGQRVSRDPRLMAAHSLGLEMLVVSMRESVYETIAHCVGGAHLKLEDVAAAPYAAALSTLAADDRDLGCVCIDMGAGSTSAAVFAGGALTHIDSLPYGGAHVTRDVAQGLSTSIREAERVKTTAGSAIASAHEDRETIEVAPRADDQGAEPLLVERSLLKGIIAPRVEETLEVLRDRLRQADALPPMAHLVLTGGASQLTGVREVATRVFDRPVSLGRPTCAPELAQTVSGPGLSAPVGVLSRAAFGPVEIGLDHPVAARERERPIPANGNLISRTAAWLIANL